MRSFAVSLGLEWKLPDHKTVWRRVQMPLAHSWQVRPLIHALFRKDSCLSERTSNGSFEVAGVSSIAWLTCWRKRNWDSSEVQLKLRERSSLESLSAILFQVLVPARIERVAMRNVHKPQGIFLTAHPVGCNRPELHAGPHQAATAQSESSKVVELSDRLHTLLLPWLQANRWKEVRGDP